MGCLDFLKFHFTLISYILSMYNVPDTSLTIEDTATNKTDVAWERKEVKWCS